MVVNCTLASVSATAGTVPTFPAYVGASDQSSSSTAKISSTQDTTGGVYTKYTHQYVDAAGNVQTVGAAASNFVRYCEYPGSRLFSKVKFEVNGNPLDDYTSEAYVYHQKFRVAPNKLTGWKRLVGQEVPVDGVSDLSTVSGASNWASTVVGLTGQDSAAVSGAPTNASATSRKMVQFLAGPQTPKATQPALDLWIPLIFW